MSFGNSFKSCVVASGLVTTNVQGYCCAASKMDMSVSPLSGSVSLPVPASGWLMAELAGTIRVGILLGIDAVAGNEALAEVFVPEGSDVGAEVDIDEVEVEDATIKYDWDGVYPSSLVVIALEVGTVAEDTVVGSTAGIVIDESVAKELTVDVAVTVPVAVAVSVVDVVRVMTPEPDMSGVDATDDTPADTVTPSALAEVEELCGN